MRRFLISLLLLIATAVPAAAQIPGPSWVVPSRTWLSLPSATTAGLIYRCSNCGTKGSVWMADGARWKPLNGSAVFASLDATSASINNVETIVFQYLIPATVWHAGDRLSFKLAGSKSGATDSYVLALRIGTAGTTSDTSIFSPTALAAAGRQFGEQVDVRLENATSVQTIPRTSADIGYGGSQNAAVAAPVTISNVSNPLYVSITLRSTGTTDTVNLVEGILTYIAGAN